MSCRFLLALEYYFVLFGMPGLVITLFVLYVYLKERYKRPDWFARDERN